MQRQRPDLFLFIKPQQSFSFSIYILASFYLYFKNQLLCKVKLSFYIGLALITKKYMETPIK